jgi:hypothetical protein
MVVSDDVITETSSAPICLRADRTATKLDKCDGRHGCLVVIPVMHARPNVPATAGPVYGLGRERARTAWRSDPSRRQAVLETTTKDNA